MECRVCHDDKLPAEMKQAAGKPCKICRRCDGKQREARYRKTPRSRARKDRINAKMRQYTVDPSKADKFIFMWSRRSDKRKGRENNLTRDFIRSEIAKPCAYCGRNYGRMTLDRIDNNVGHLVTNVVPCCLRCNYIKRDIPHAAWLIMAPAVKEAIEKGLFGDWDGSWKKRHAGGP